MDFRKYMEIVKAKKGFTYADLARGLDWAPNNFHNKLRSGNIRVKDLARISDLLGVEIRFIDKKTGEIL